MHMNDKAPRDTVALLTSGGLDSCILLGHLLKLGRTVQPVYILTGVSWQVEELTAVREFTGALRSPRLRELVALELPLDDLYAEHWSITGQGVPPEDTPDEAVYLPGRNPLLLVKAAVWCQMHGIEELAIAPLASNPFPDATDEFFTAFARAMTLGCNAPLRIIRPFAQMTKPEVMALGGKYPLEHTFSCISPADGLHCGRCNKCDERKAAFKQAGLTDPTRYATLVSGVPHQRVLL
jgi:7-cyano-7-deazaguanine synthase